MTSKDENTPLEEEKPVATEGKYLFERASSQVVAEAEPTQDEYDDYYEAMQTGPTEEDIYESMKVKLKWSRVLLVGFIIGLIFCGITLLIVWLVARADRPQLWLFLPWIYFIEFGLMFNVIKVQANIITPKSPETADPFIPSGIMNAIDCLPFDTLEYGLSNDP